MRMSDTAEPVTLGYLAEQMDRLLTELQATRIGKSEELRAEVGEGLLLLRRYNRDSSG